MRAGVSVMLIYRRLMQINPQNCVYAFQNRLVLYISVIVILATAFYLLLHISKYKRNVTHKS